MEAPASPRDAHVDAAAADPVRQENQVLLKKLHDVVARYRTLQTQYQALASERGAATGAMDGKAEALAKDAADKAASALESDSAVAKLEDEKRELIDKLKQVVGKCRAMQKQLQEAKEENELLKSPAKQTPTEPAGENEDVGAQANGGAPSFAAAARLHTLEKELAVKEAEKCEVEGQLRDVVVRYHGLQQQLEEQTGELEVALSKVEAFKLELASQQEAAARIQETDAGVISELNDQLQQKAQQFTQGEARVLVLQDENARLNDQVASIMEEKQQQEREYHELVAENGRLLDKVADMTQQVTAWKQQDAEAKALQSDTSAQLERMVAENKALQEQLEASERILMKAQADQEAASSARSKELEDRLQELEQQLQTEKETWEAERHEFDSQVSALRASGVKATQDLAEVEELRELVLVHMGVDLTFDNISALLDTKNKEVQLLTDRIAEYEMRMSDLGMAGRASDSLNICDSDGEQATTTSESECQCDDSSDHHASSSAEKEAAVALESLREQLKQLTVQLEQSHFEREAAAQKIAAYEMELATLRSELESQERPDAGDACAQAVVDALRAQLAKMQSQLEETEAEMASCKAENMRMIFEVAKTADGAVKLKQDHESLVDVHRETASEIETMSSQMESLATANAAFQEQLLAKERTLDEHLETFAKEKELFEAKFEAFKTEIGKLQKEKSALQTDLDDIKAENDVLEERINELHAIAESKSGSDNCQDRDRDREVENLRSSLVQAKVEFLEQKQQLSALEKKLVDISQKSPVGQQQNSGSIDTERKEFEAALIEMIEMEKKLQAAYEAKQNLEMALQERMEEKSELEGRLSNAHDKITEQEEQLEQMLTIISTLEDQLRALEKEKEVLAQEYEAIKAKLEKSEGKLEEKVVEFEAFRTTTNMLKDERTRLFGEIARLQDKIVNSEEQKAEIASSQQEATKELEEQLDELADKIAELETDKQELRAQLEEAIDRSDDEIDRLRDRMYIMEEEKTSLVEKLDKADVIIEDLEASAAALEQQNADLTSELAEANEASSQRIEEMEAHLEKTSEELAAVVKVKCEMAESVAMLEQQVKSASIEKSAIARKMDETTHALQNEIEALKSTAEDLEREIEEAQLQLANATASHALAMDEMNVQVGEKSEHILSLEAERDEMKHRMQSVEVELDTERAELVATSELLERTKVEFAAELKSLIRTVEFGEAEIEKLTTTLSEQRAKMEEVSSDLQSKLDEASHHASDLEAALTVVNEEKTGVQAEVERLEGVLAEQTEKANAIASQLAELQVLQSTLITDKQELESTLAERNTAAQVLLEEITQLKAQAEMAEQVHAGVVSQVEEANEKIASLELELDEIQAQRMSEKQDGEEELMRIRMSETTAQDALFVLTQQHTAATAELEKLRSAKKDLMEKLVELGADIKDVEARRESETRDLQDLLSRSQECESRLNDELREVMEQLTSVMAQVTATEEARDVALASVEASELKCQALQKQLESLASDQRTAEATVSDLRSQIATLDEKLAAAQREIERVQTEMAQEAETARAERAAAASDAADVIQSLETQVADVTSKYNASQNELTQLRERHTEEMAASATAMSETSKQVVNLQALVTNLEEKLQTSKNELDRVVEEREVEVARLTASATETTARIAALEAQIAELVEQCDDSKRELSHAKEAHGAEVERLVAAAAEATERIAGLEARHTALDGQYQTTESELRRVTEQRDAEAERNAAAEATAVQKISELETQVADLHEKAQASEGERMREAAQYQSEVEQLRVTTKEGTDKIRDLESQLTELDAQFECARNELAHTAQSHNAQVEKLTSAARDAAETICELEAQVLEARDQYTASQRELTAAIEQQKAQVEQFEVESNKKDESIRSLEAQAAALLREREDAVATAKVQREQIEQHEQSCERLESENTALRQEQSSWAQELRALEQQLQSSAEQARALETQIATLQDVSQALRTERDEAVSAKQQAVEASQSEAQALRASISALEKQLSELMQAVQDKEVALTTALERIDAAENKHDEAMTVALQSSTDLEKKLAAANHTIEELQHARNESEGQRALVTDLERAIEQLKSQLTAETDAAAVARSQLDVYRKRAHVALKKATSESKLNLKKSSEDAAKLEQELMTAKGRIAALEADVVAAEQRAQASEAEASAREETARLAAAIEKREAEASQQAEVLMLKAEVVRMEALLKEKAPLENNLHDLREANDALKEETAALTRALEQQTERMHEKNDELALLKHQLQDAIASSSSGSGAPASRRPSMPRSDRGSFGAYYLSEKERRSSSTVSSSLSIEADGNNNNLLYRSSSPTSDTEQDQHLSAAVADSRAIPLARLASLREPSSDDSNVVKTAKALDVDSSALKQQAGAWAEKAQYYQKKFEDTQALWEEAVRQKKRLQELAERSQNTVNVEYLKNVMIKYIESHNASEKARLVPVIAAVLQFSPTELQQAQAAHSADDTAGGLLGGVFSLFGGSQAAAPAPKPLAMPANFRRAPSASPHGDYVEKDDDDDDAMAVLNPFAV